MLHLERLTSAAHPLYLRARALYRQSFPWHEQREEASQQAILQDGAYHFDLAFDGETFVGEVLYWEVGRFLYIEHFCILPELRNRHYGAQVLELLKEKPLLLEIDPPGDALSCRRKGFYQRCGFTENSFRHVHPAYHDGTHGHALTVMSAPAPLTEEEYAAFAAFLQNRVMRDAYRETSLTFRLPEEGDRENVLDFYEEFAKARTACIGCGGYADFDKWLTGMQNRHTGENLPEGYVRENFYLCYDGPALVGVFSLKFSLTPWLLEYGGHIGYAVRPSRQRQGLATRMLCQGLALAAGFGFDRVLCVCDADNTASERVIVKNGGNLENQVYDREEKVWVKRYWITL